MPKIKTIVHIFGDKKVALEIWHNNKNHFYIKGGLPLWVLNVLGSDISTEYYDSPDKLDYAIRLFAQDYTKAITTAKKIIVYNITFGEKTVDKLDIRGTKYYGSGRSRLNGFGFNIEYHICMQHTIDSKDIIKEFVSAFYGSKDLVENNRNYDLKYDETIIDWTPEREKFFAELNESTNNLCDKIKNFFGEEDEEQLKAIDSGVKLLK